MKSITNIDDYYKLQQAIREIKADYGVNVSVNQKRKTLYKFGENKLVGTSLATIMTLPSGETEETYVFDNLITHFASASTADSGIELVVEGHTIDGNGNYTFVVQKVNLAGQTKTALTTPLARITRAYNNNTTNLTGPVYFAEDVTFTSGVPGTASAIHMIIPAGENQTQKCSTAISQYDFYIITTFYVGVLKKTSGYASARIEFRQKQKVFRPITPYFQASNVTGIQKKFDSFIVVPNNSDVIVRAVADASSTDVTASIHGYLAIIV